MRNSRFAAYVLAGMLAGCSDSSDGGAPTADTMQKLGADALHYFSFDEPTLIRAGQALVAQNAVSERPAAEIEGASVIGRGARGGAISFSAPDHRVTVQDSANDRPATLAAWVRLREGSNNGTIIDKHEWGPASTETRGWVMRVRDGRLDFTVGKEGWHSVLSNEAVPTGRWVHVATTYDGRTARLYIDGRLDAYGPLPQATASGLEICFGNGAFELSRSRMLDGALDEILISERVLADAEVAALATPTVPQRDDVGQP